MYFFISCKHSNKVPTNGHGYLDMFYHESVRINQALYFPYSVLEIQKLDTYLVMVACPHGQGSLCLVCDFLCFHMYLLLQRFCSWVKSAKF